jgi:hypothetical protein
MSTNVKRLKSSSLLPSTFCLLPSAFYLASTTNINADLLSPQITNNFEDASEAMFYKQRLVQLENEYYLRLEVEKHNI